MITIKNVKTLAGDIETIEIPSKTDEIIDAEQKLTMLPALIDAHVHFCTPGEEQKEDWITGTKAAINGGVTTVFDMPNNTPACINLKSLQEKKEIIDKQLNSIGAPLHYHLYLGADKEHIESIGLCKNLFVAVKIYMGPGSGSLIMNDEKDLERVFQLGAQTNFIVAVHAKDEKLIKDQAFKYAKEKNPSVHSKIRDKETAVRAVQKTLFIAEKFNTQLYVLHVSTKEEVSLIREAKKRGLLIFAETTPHHLFLSENDYAALGTKIQTDPPLRTLEDQKALLEGIHDGTIDSVGSGHAPHTLQEKMQPYGKAPSGIPGIETMLPLLLNAVNEGKITLEQVVQLTRINLENIYSLQHNKDIVLVDMELEKPVRNENLKTKCGWSPYAGKVLKGWPIYTIFNGNIYKNS